MFKAPPLTTDVADDAALEIYLSQPGLKVIEIYSEWCGPCLSVLPTFKRIRLEKDDPACLTFLMVCAEKCKLLDEAKEHKGTSEPVFLLFRNGVCKKEHKIKGANTPLMANLISDLTPNSPDQDEAENNPYAVAIKDKTK